MCGLGGSGAIGEWLDDVTQRKKIEAALVGCAGARGDTGEDDAFAIGGEHGRMVILAGVVGELLEKFSVEIVKIEMDRAVALDEVLTTGDDDQGAAIRP